jgi:hypothetical protein
MPDVVSSIVISYVPIFILGCLLDLIASGVWVWRHAYAGILHQGGLSGPIVFWGDCTSHCCELSQVQLDLRHQRQEASGWWYPSNRFARQANAIFGPDRNKDP